MDDDPRSDARAHLVPLLEAFYLAGIHPVGQLFERCDDEWVAHLRGPLDPGLIEAHCITDPYRDELRISTDKVECLHCHTSIIGPQGFWKYD